MSVYLERGQRVTVLARFRLPSKANPPAPVPAWLEWRARPKGAPRNVLIEREDGQRIVRSFRGLRRPAARTTTPPATPQPAHQQNGDQ